MPKASAAVPQLNTSSAVGIALSPSSDAIAGAEKLISEGLFGDTPKAAPEPVAAPVTAPKAEAAPEAESEQKAAPTTNAEAQEEGYASLDDYLTKTSIDRESFYSLPVKAKVDGKELDVPLAKLVESYQIGEHLAHKSNAFAEERRAWDAERTQVRTQLQQQLQTAQKLGELAQQELLREYAGVTPDDPARYLAAQQRIGAIHQWLQNNLQAQQQVSAAQLQAEQQRLLDAVPEWRDHTKFQEASKQLTSYAATRGFAQAELSGLTDHRYLMVLRDAARAQDLQAQVDTLKAQLEGRTAAKLKLVRAAPAMASPGARITQNPIRSRLADTQAAMRADKRHSMDSTLRAAQALVDAGIGA